MHPNTFLKHLWRPIVLDQVFVAMSFEKRFQSRYENIIKPAIEDEPIAGKRLIAYRVDNSKTGDSILTDISDGIAHSLLVLADVSVIDEGRYHETPIRNGNVMYEVGISLACRNPSEVLLIRDDAKKFLFDVSTVPHLTVNFASSDTAMTEIRKALTDRVLETKYVNDARIQMAVSTLTSDEVFVLEALDALSQEQAKDLSMKAGILSIPTERGVSGLLRRGAVKNVGLNEETGGIFFQLTPFGRALAKVAKTQIPKYTPKHSLPE